jgi:hypothetical protein
MGVQTIQIPKTQVLAIVDKVKAKLDTSTIFSGVRLT